MERWVVLALAWLAGFLIWGIVLSVSPVLSIIKTDFVLTYAQVGLLFSAPITTLVACAIPGGVIADRIGVRRAVGLALIVVTFSGFMRAMSSSFYLLLAFSFLLGAGWGFTVPNLPKIVRGWFPRELAGTATGIYVTGILIGMSIALAFTRPLLLPIYGSWRGVFYVWSAMLLVITVFWWILVRDPYVPPKTHTSDFFKDDSSVYLNRAVWLVALMFAINCSFTYNIAGWLPTFFTQRGLSPDISAIMVSMMTFVGIPTVFLIPLASDRVGLRKPFIMFSFLAAAIMNAVLLKIPANFGWLATVIFGITQNSSFALFLTLPTELVEKRFLGRASGLILSVGYAGAASTPWLVGYILDITGTFDYGFFMFSVALIIAMALTFMLPETAKKKSD